MLEPGDEPAPVTDLAAAPASLGIELTWTATGDDGTVGTAASYDIRYASSPILTDDAFDAATQVQGEPDPAESGMDESFTVTGLDFDATYHFAMKPAVGGRPPSDSRHTVINPGRRAAMNERAIA